MVYDKETGKSRGYGFLEYRTADEAKTAIRNLNNHVFYDRTIKVDWSNANDRGKRSGAENGAAPAPGDGALPVLPPGVELAPGLGAPDAISQTLASIPTPQLLDILSQMKALVTSDPGKATALLQQAPQLAYALFQALMLMGLADTNILAALVVQVGQQAAPAAQQIPPPISYPQQLPPQGSFPHVPPPMHQQPQGFPQPSYMQQQPPQQQQQQFATPPPAHQAYALPPMQQPPYGAAPAPASSVDPVEVVRNLTSHQFALLDQNTRNDVMNLRASMGLPPIPA